MKKSAKFMKVRDASRRFVRGLVVRHHKYYGRFAVNGKVGRHPLEARPPNVEAAKDELAALKKSEIEPPKPIKFRALTVRYLDGMALKKRPSTIAKETRMIDGELVPHFGGEDIGSISTTKIDDFLTTRAKRKILRRNERGELVEKPVAHNTIVNSLRVLSAIMNYAVLKEFRRDNPCAKIEMDLKPAEPKRAVPRSEIFAVADYIRKNLKMGEMISDAFLFLAFTGARLTSGMSTKWEKVSFENNRIVLGKTKNGDPIYLPLWGPLREVLERARNERGCNPSHYIFPSYRAPGMPEDRPLKEFRHSISRACAALGIPRLTHHYLRHFFISEAVMVGIPAKTVAELVGHKDGGMLVSSTYSHLIPGHLEEMMGKLEKSYAVAEPRPPLVLLPKVA